MAGSQSHRAASFFNQESLGRMVKVKIREKGGQQQNYDFNQSEVTIGRMKGNDIVLPKGNVSKKHARIYSRNGALVIDDLNSTNGTYVNGRKVTNEHDISDSDKIYIGDFILQVEPEQARAGGPPQAPPQPPAGGQSGNHNSAPNTGANNASGTGQQNSSPPSPPGGPTDKRPSANNSLGALDEKYGNGSGNSGPSRSATRRDPAVQGGQNSGPQQAAGNRPGSAPSEAPSPPSGSAPSEAPVGASPGSAPSSAPSAPSSPSGAPSGDSSPGRPPSESGVGGGSGSSPSSPGGGGRRSRSGGSSRGRAARRRRSRSGSHGSQSADAAAPPEKSGGAQKGVQQEESSRVTGRDKRLDGGRRKRARTAPSVPEIQFGREFDDEFHAAQQEVGEEVLAEVSLDELPLAYPPLPEDREEFEAIVAGIVEDLDPDGDHDRLVDTVTSECVALGPIEEYLDDAEVDAIYVNAHDRVVLERGDETVVAPRAFSLPEMLELVAYRLLGTRESTLLTDQFRFGDGTRGNVVLPPLAVDGPLLTFEKPTGRHSTLDDLADEEALSEGMQSFLETAVESGRTILVAGPDAEERSTVLEALARLIPDGTRTVSIEETARLQLPQQSFARLEVSEADGYDVSRLIEAATAMGSDRIILDSCNAGGAYEWVGAAATARRGSLAGINGLSASDALARLQGVSQLDARDTNPRGLREQIARAVDLVVVVNRRPDGGTRIQQITEVQGVDLDAFRLNDVFYFREQGAAGHFHPTGYIPVFFEDLQQIGEDVDLGIFRD